MRWMLLTETYPPEVNGVAMTLSKLSEGLIARGHQVHIVRPKQNKYDRRIPRPANPSHSLVWGVPLPWYKGLKLGFPRIGQLRYHIHHFRPDFLHIATEGALGLAGVLAAHAYRVPTVSSYHTNFISYSRYYKSGFLRRIAFEYFRAMHNATLRTFVPSQSVLQNLKGFKYNNLEIMSRGVDTQLYTPTLRCPQLRQSWGVAQGDIVMLYVGRLAIEKNLPLLIQCYERLRAREPRAKLVLVGDGPLRADLQASHPHFIYAGQLTGTQLARHYASADLFIFTSFTETYGNVLMEAMASGLTCLSYDYAAAREHIRHGTNGYLAAYKNEPDYYMRFDELLQNRALWPSISAAARQTTEGLSWENVVAKYEATLLDLKANAR